MLTPIDPLDAVHALRDAAGVSPALCRMASRMRRLFSLAAPDAPGLALAGAVLALDEREQAAAGTATMSVTGNGLTLAEALTTCFGEAADTLSQFERAGDLAGSRSAPQLMSGWIEQAAGPAAGIDWILGHDARDGHAMLVPADICLRRRPDHRAFAPAGALSSGCAAGPTLANACARATFELIERDAAAMWWLGGRQGAPLPVLPVIDTLLQRLRAGVHGRQVVLLDITTEIGVPVVAACSHDRDGRYFACGVACRSTLEQSATAALLEMAQMEMSAPVAHAKAAEQGDAALNAADIRHIARSRLNVLDLPMLTPTAQAQASAGAADPASSLDARGHELVFVDMTRPDIGVPVARAVSPGLQPFAESPITPRLAAIIAKTGGGARHNRGIMPF